MKKIRVIAKGVLTVAILGGLIVSGADARGRNGGGQGQGQRLRDGSCLTQQSGAGTAGTNQAGQRAYSSGTVVRPMDGTGRGYGDGTQPRPMDGTGFGRGATGK